MCKMFGKEPDDDFLNEMSPMKKLWLYECWAHEQEIEIEKGKTQAILTGSFYNPEMARKIMQRDNPQFKSTDEDFEQTYKMIEEDVLREQIEKTQRVSKRQKRKRELIK